ncbi:MAG: 4'-phosphopantetheinyl transferase superfamily protein [Pseudomonadota bacterium]
MAAAGLLAHDLNWFSEQEHARWTVMTAVRRRTQFVAGRWWARQCLAATAGGCWQDYVLSAPEGGAPTVLHAPSGGLAQGLHFSLSHSADWLACAVASHPVGVDVEDVTRQRDTDALGDWIYGPHERSYIDAMPASARGDQFFALWTLKEAWIKQATETGGHASMRAVQFRPCAALKSHAVVLQAPSFTLAVVSSSAPWVLRCEAPELTGLPIAHWAMVPAERV